MWHTIADIAEERFLPEREFVEFAVANNAIYGVIEIPFSKPQVSTWNVDDLVNAFRSSNPALCAKVRDEKIKQIEANLK